MNTPRIFCLKSCTVSSVVELTDRVVIHKLKDVLRLKKGDRFYLFDGQGKEYGCRVEMIGRKSIQVLVERMAKIETEPKVKLHLGLALIKEPRIEIALEKATELGVDRIVLFPAERSLKKQLPAPRLERLKRIITEASRQSGRNVIPGISVVKTLPEFIKETQSNDCRIFLEAYQDISRDTEQQVRQAKDILLAVGPEGDFTEDEKKLLEENGFIPWHFSLPVLRAETAALFAVGLVRYIISRE